MSKARQSAGHGPRRKCLSVAIALTLAGAHGAADAQSDATSVEEVVVTGSRIRATGMDTPNPVTVVSPEEISLLSPTTMIEGLAQLPQFFNSNTTANTGGFFTSPGAGTLNLRGLQGKRTLSLLDGRRVVSSTIFGGPDINLFPEHLVRSVETVTGGATAAYGTDAVAGVVNFILNTDFEGIRASLQSGQTAKGHNQHHEISLAGGWALTDKTHLLVSLEDAEQDPIWHSRADYDWYQGRALIENPDTANRGTTPDNPWFLPYRNVVSRNASLDGILYLPDSAGGPQILDRNGNASPFVVGSVFNADSHSIANGGSGTDNGEWGSQIQPASGRENAFVYLRHDITDNLRVYGQGIYGEAYWINTNLGGLFPRTGFGSRAFTIYSGNPFLPAEVQQAMTDNGIESIPFGRIGAPEDLAFNAYTEQVTEMRSLTGGFEYDISSDGFFDGWAVQGWYQKGQTDVDAIQRGGIRLDRVYLAADAVLDADGNIVCNVTLYTNDYDDCVPLNLFGRGRASAEAVDWVTGFEPGVPMHAEGFYSATETIPYSYTSGEDKMRRIEMEQDAFEITATGKIADGWGAGPIEMAFGYAWREESFLQYVLVGPGGNVNADPRGRPVEANNPARGIRGVPGGNAASGNSVEIQFSNVPFGRGSFQVKEAFTEFNLPLVSGKRLVEQLDLNLATRWADYEGSGDVWSWKGATSWAINDQLRLRGTLSQDVRAATMGERFDRTGGVASVTDFLEDPAGGSAVTYTVTQYSGGSPDIQPEEAKTFTAGLIYQPRWVEGFSVSTDWYSIEVKDNINQYSATGVVSGCYLDGDQDLCALITREGDPSVINPGVNRISLIGVPYINQNSVIAKGVDFEVGYRTDVGWFGGGLVGVRLLGSYLRENSSTNSAGVTTETTGVFGLPKWNYILSGNFNRGPLGVSMLARYTGRTVQNLNWNWRGASTRWDVLDNTIESQVIVDARANYRFQVGGGTLNVFATINNLFDEDPIPFLTTFDGFFTNATGNGVVGDLRGRRYAVGLSLDF
jgi:iron complex outermembrane recepter protein